MCIRVRLWAAFIVLIGIILFVLSYKIFGKKHGVQKESWGSNADFKYVELYSPLISMSNDNVFSLIIESILSFFYCFNF